MSNLLFSLIFGFFINSDDSSCIEKFHFAATKDTAHVGSTFIKFNVSDSSGNIITVLSPNYTTYAYFKIYKDLSLESYQKLMNQILKSNYYIDYFEFKKLRGHVILADNKYVDRIWRRGKSKFIRHFFEKNVFKLEYQEYFEAVISKLFDYGILVALRHNGVYSIVYDCDCL
jgi:hypothetical protein